jgi:hypothetical protein
MAKLDAAVPLGRTVTIHYLGTTACDPLPTYGEAPAPYNGMLHTLVELVRSRAPPPQPQAYGQLFHVAVRVRAISCRPQPVAY